MKALNDRIETLDYLRGFALLGIILVNVEVILSILPLERRVDIVYKHILDYFVEGKFFSIFSILFGVGFYIFMQRAQARHDHAQKLFVRRLVILAAIGFVHQFFHDGEALLPYAIYGFVILVLFFNRSKQVNVTVGLILLVIFSLMGAKLLLPLAYFILGLSAAQYGLLHTFYRHRHVWRRIAVISGLLSCVAVGIMYYFSNMVHDGFITHGVTSTVAEEDWDEAVYTYVVLLCGPVLTCFYISGLITVLNTVWGQKLLYPLKAYGRMALTNYIGQTVLLWLVVRISHDKDWHFATTFWLCLTILCVQMLFSQIWLHYCRLGPLEYVWKMGTYQKRLPLLKGKSYK